MRRIALEHRPFDCVGDMKTWLFAHFITARCIDLFLFADFALVYYWVMLIVYLRVPSSRIYLDSTPVDFDVCLSGLLLHMCEIGEHFSTAKLVHFSSLVS